MTQREMSIAGANRDGSASDEWWTPPAIFEALSLEFDLDPCAPAHPGMPWLPAAQRISRPADGLSAAWRGRVWLNPPYGKQTGRWVSRLAEHGDGVALVFARTDASWLQAALCAADAACFVAGRIPFIDATRQMRAPGTHSPSQPSILLAFGSGCVAAVAASGLGAVYAQRAASVPRGDEPLWT